MFISTKKIKDSYFKLAAGSLVVCLFATPQSSAQIIASPPATSATTAHAQENAASNNTRYIKKGGVINLGEMADYYQAHPTQLVRNFPFDEGDENEIRTVRPSPDPSKIHMYNPGSARSAETPHTAYLPVSAAPADTFSAQVTDGMDIPPDVHGAVNESYAVSTHNDSIVIQDRVGNTVKKIQIDNFWSSLETHGTGAYDPRVIYDPHYNRWIMVGDCYGETNFSQIMIAVSQTNDPTGLWNLYVLSLATTSGDWLDFPNVGFNYRWIAVSGNFFTTPGAYLEDSLYVFDYANMMSGAAMGAFQAFLPPVGVGNSFTICPAETYDTTESNLYCAESWNGAAGQLQLYKVSGSAIGSLTISAYANPATPTHWQSNPNCPTCDAGNDFVPQLASTHLLQGNDDRINNLQQRNGVLWCAQSVFYPATGTTNRASSQWWELDTNGTVAQVGVIDDPAGVINHWFPSISSNWSNDALIGYAISSTALHPSCGYSIHMHTDPADSSRPSYIYRHGQNTYYQNFGGQQNRWGDYSATCTDPTNGLDFWTIQETVPATANYWNTWWAYVQICQKPAASISSVGSTTVCAGATVTLNAAPTSGVTYQWELGGSAIAGATNGTYLATVAGTYNVIVYNSATCDSTSLPVVVSLNPLPAAITGTMTLCNGGTTNLTDATAGGTWSAASGTGSVNVGTSGIVTGTSTGTATISYTSAAGCLATTTVTVNSGPTATITAGGATEFCTGGSVVLNANTGAGLTYQWQVGGVNITGATSSSYTATTSGSYTVIVYQAGCSTTSAATVVTVDVPLVPTPIGGATTNVCDGQTITLTDATSGGTWSSGNIAVATVNSSGVVTGASLGTVIISYATANTCGTVYATTTVTVNIPTTVAAITGTLDICVGGTSTLSDVTASGVWSSSNTAIATVSGGGLVTGMAAGTANISYSVTSSAGCASSAVTTVTVSSPFTATITPLSATTFCSGGYVVLDATAGAGYTYQWQLGGTNIAGATSSSYTASNAGNYTVIIADPGGCTSTSSAVTVTINAGSIVTPTDTITASLGTTLCTTTLPETFTATPVNGGTAPTYQWYVNGTATGTGVTYVYTPANGDIVTCVMTSNYPCAFPDTAVYSLTMTIAPAQTPSVSITSVHGDSVCATGDSVQFTALPVFGGTAPTYVWTRNGTNVATGPSFIYPPNNNDTLIVTMTSNYPCLATPTAVSQMFIIHVFAQIPNSLSVSVSQATVMAGLADTFTAIATGAGASPSFQWYINGNPVPGATSFRYITDSLQDGQIVSCEEKSSFLCSNPYSIMSGDITIHVIPNSVQQVGNSGSHFTLLPNPNRGEFTISGTTSLPGNDKVTIVMSDVLGQTILSKVTQASNGTVNEHISLGNTIPNGNYMVMITSGEDHVVFHVTIDR